MMKRQSPTAADHGSRPGLRDLPIPAVTVLHVDDDPNDTELLRAAVRKAGLQIILHNAEDAEQAIAYLSGEGIYADRNICCLPRLVLLDLKMPRIAGFEVLKWIRGHPQFHELPVVVLSGSELQDDIRLAYASGANLYLVKPLGFEALVQMVRELDAAWAMSVVPKARGSNVFLSEAI
jgi:CheY-like chemotaxis protein